MREFTVYIALDAKGKLTASAGARLESYCGLLHDASLRFVWLCPVEKLRAGTLRVITRLERKHCAFRRLIVRNTLLRTGTAATPAAKYLLWKYKFVTRPRRSSTREEDAVAMHFGNEPVSCDYRSCLGNSVFIREDGSLGICPFHDNGIRLNESAELSSVYDIFSTPEFVELLKKTIAHRADCKSGCPHFALCKGGCPLKMEENIPQSCPVRTAVDRAGGADPALCRRELRTRGARMYRVP